MIKLNELTLVQIWERQLLMGENLVANSADDVRVLYAGRRNRDRGPDFTGAVISFSGGEPLNGDIELHLRARDWKTHGHHRDVHYNDVVLHVVWDGYEPVVLQNGKEVPTLNIRDCLKVSLDEIGMWLSLPMVRAESCYGTGQTLSERDIGGLLDALGEERFQLKAASFARMMDYEPPSQVLYQGILRALGYTKNKEAFEELAQRLPLSAVEAYCRGKSRQEQVILLKALFLGTAGLLPREGSDDLERLWHRMGYGVEMNASWWHLFRVRPENHPARRLIGAAHLLARFIECGLVEGIISLIQEDEPGVGRSETGFMVAHQEERSNSKSTYIGRGRAREIVVNIVLPFVFAWAEANLERGLAEHVEALYRGYPRAGENEITREAASLLSGTCDPGLVNSARRQQGLLHLDKTYCRQRWCTACPIAGLLPGISG
ncbi:MAG: DUF2851 family protein [Chloroflexota bacterium]|nr:DUF2851 family protein [Chloroflexota bacterium]